jgi:hypothetical protein
VIIVVPKRQRLEYPIEISRCENINSKILIKCFCRGQYILSTEKKQVMKETLLKILGLSL